MGILSVGTDLPAVHAQENVDGEKRRTGITVVERPVDEQRFQQRRAHRDHISVVTRLRAEEGAFQEAGIAQPRRSAKAVEHARVNRDDFLHREVANRLNGRGGARVPHCH